MVSELVNDRQLRWTDGQSVAPLRELTPVGRDVLFAVQQAAGIARDEFLGVYHHQGISFLDVTFEDVTFPQEPWCLSRDAEGRT